MVSNPPGIKPPGYKPSRERLREYDRVAAVGHFFKNWHDAEEERKKRRKPSVEHFGDFRDGHKVLRKPNGRFAKETVPRHRRPLRVPW